MVSLLLAIDFGGTKTAVAVGRLGSETWIDYQRQPSPLHTTAQGNIENALRISRKLLTAHPGRLAAVGVSFGGPVDFDSGTVLRSYHEPGWENQPLREKLKNEFGVPVSIDNDAVAGALGEWRFGAGQKCKSLFYITISTGIGGGWIIDERPYRGINSMAGEIGHLIVEPNGPQCSCGRRGCLETLACGPAIARRASEQMERFPKSGRVMRQLLVDNSEQLTAELVSRAAELGDALAQEVLLEAAHHLGKAIGDALMLMNPERIILGGGVTKAGEAYWEEIRRTAYASVWPDISVDIVPAALGDDAPLWGGIVLAEALVANTSK